MRRLWAMKWFRLLSGLLALLCLAVLATCWQYRIWKPSDYAAYEEISRYAVGEDLWFGRIKPGQELEALVAAHPHNEGPARSIRVDAVLPGVADVR